MYVYCVCVCVCAGACVCVQRILLNIPKVSDEENNNHKYFISLIFKIGGDKRP